jgi:flagellar hook-associated protein 1
VDSYDIGMSGLSASQQAFEVIGNNIANASTDGYHRQTLKLSAAFSSLNGQNVLGGGVDVEGVTRAINELLDEQIVRQQSCLSQLSQETDTLSTIEAAFGELSSDSGLSVALDKFFNSLKDLSAYPDQTIYQNAVIACAQELTSQFRSLDEFLTTLEEQIELEAQDTVEKINNLIQTISELNNNIKEQQTNGGQTNNLCDDRSRCISELSRLVGVDVQAADFNGVNLNIAGMSVLNGTSIMELELGYNQDGSFGFTVNRRTGYTADVEGGKLGGLLSLKNNLISDIHDNLNSLASAVIQHVNQYHVEGVGTDGSFTDLAGDSVSSENLADIVPALASGNIYIRVINTQTGEVTRTPVYVDVTEDSEETLESLAEDISAITGISASVSESDNRLYIHADSGYVFDFLPAVLPEPTESTFAYSSGGTEPEVSVSGIYTGDENQTFTFTVSGEGSVGNGTLEITVADGDGHSVATFNIGAGYVAGDELNLGNGIKVSLGAGDLADGDSFEVDAFMQTDQTGLLAAAGLNTFFSGKDASDIDICSDIINSSGRIAVACGSDMTDNTNISRLAGLSNESVTDLDSMTIGDFYHQMVTDIGSVLSSKETMENSLDTLVKNLTDQQSDISGVDINQQAAQMLVYEQMFNAMAKYLNNVQTSLDQLMRIL